MKRLTLAIAIAACALPAAGCAGSQHATGHLYPGMYIPPRWLTTVAWPVLLLVDVGTALESLLVNV